MSILSTNCDNKILVHQTEFHKMCCALCSMEPGRAFEISESTCSSHTSCFTCGCESAFLDDPFMMLWPCPPQVCSAAGPGTLFWTCGACRVCQTGISVPCLPDHPWAMIGRFGSSHTNIALNMQLHACQRAVAADVRPAGVLQKASQPPKAFIPAPPCKVCDAHNQRSPVARRVVRGPTL